MEASSQRDCASAREALAANGGDERFAIPATELDQHAHTPAAE
jgi:hypothetical protein